MNNKKALETELAYLLDNMNGMDPTDDGYNEYLEAARILADLIIEIEKNEIDLKKEEIKSTVPKSRIILDAAKIIVPSVIDICLFVWGTNTTLKFEETGRFTSKTSGLIFGNLPKLWRK